MAMMITMLMIWAIGMVVTMMVKIDSSGFDDARDDNTDDAGKS